MKTITLWTRPDNDELLALAREAMRTALIAVHLPNRQPQAKEALDKYHAKLIAVMQPPIMIDMLRMLEDAGSRNEHLRISLTPEAS